MGSDHRIVSARVRLNLRKSKRIPRKRQFDWKALSTDSNLQSMYAIEVRTRFEILADVEEAATDKYDRFITANKEAAEKTIPARSRPRRTHISSDPRVTRARDKIRKAYEMYYQDTAEKNERS